MTHSVIIRSVSVGDELVYFQYINVEIIEDAFRDGARESNV